MDTRKSMANDSFSLLSNSSEFLNLVLNNINSCVLLLNSEVKLVAYNNALKTVFSSRKDEDLSFVRCGEAIGCAYQVEEQTQCGKTSKCGSCELRIAALNSYVDNKPVYQKHIVKPFLTYKKEKVDKHLQFSTRLFHYEHEKYIIMIIEDITKWYTGGI